MNSYNDKKAYTRYQQYLATFGIHNSQDRIADLTNLNIGCLHFYAYASEGGLRLKAVVTECGIVTPDWNEEDDWYGLMTEIADAKTIAVRLAWLLTDSATPIDGLPLNPVQVLTPLNIPKNVIAPNYWSQITEPLMFHNNNCMHFTAWFLLSGKCIPTGIEIKASKNFGYEMNIIQKEELLL